MVTTTWAEVLIRKTMVMRRNSLTISSDLSANSPTFFPFLDKPSVSVHLARFEVDFFFLFFFFPCVPLMAGSGLYTTACVNGSGTRCIVRSLWGALDCSGRSAIFMLE